ncbi:hypothetical protein [Effusibacillus pohliae]|nr:hypothetical protein [Effusibacillus pohliae]
MLWSLIFGILMLVSVFMTLVFWESGRRWTAAGCLALCYLLAVFMLSV